MFEIEELFPGRSSVLAVRALMSTKVEEWLESHSDWMETELRRSGAVLLRDFTETDPGSLSQLVATRRFPTVEYTGGNAPRQSISGSVMSSTELMRSLPIPIHTEMSYLPRWPRYLWFTCIEPPRVGGETPIADMAAVYEDLPGPLVAEFERRCLRVIRVMPRKSTLLLPKSWPGMFGVDNKEEVAALCPHADVHWESDDTLVLSSLHRPSIVNPESGRRVWFNQANIYHRSLSSECQGASQYPMRSLLTSLELALYLSRGKIRYPYDVRFGDGGAISRETMQTIRSAIWRHTRSFRWQRGDLLILDNERMGHGRNPFRGRRQIGVVLLQSMRGQTERLADEGTG